MTKNRYVLTAGAASLLLFGACGSDDDSGADNAAACDAWIAADDAVIGYLFTGQGDADSVNAAIDAAIEAADPEIEQTLVDLKASAQPQFADPESEGSDETLALYGDTIAWVGDNCDVETLDVTAVDYGFDGVPDELSTGYHVVDVLERGSGTARDVRAALQRRHDRVARGDSSSCPRRRSSRRSARSTRPVRRPAGATPCRGTSPNPAATPSSVSSRSGSVGETEGDGPPHFTRAWSTNSR